MTHNVSITLLNPSSVKAEHAEWKFRSMGISNTKHSMRSTLSSEQGSPPTSKPNHMQSLAILAQKYYSQWPNLATPEAEALKNEIESLMRQVTPAHVDIKRASTEVDLIVLCETEHFVLCAFAMKRGHVMPIHNHPSMTVFSRILLGDMFVRTYQVDEEQERRTPVGDPIAAQVGMSRIVSGVNEDSLIVCQPGGFTLHTFAAESDDVVLLDLLGPPSNHEERDSTFYSEVRITRDTRTMQEEKLTSEEIRGLRKEDEEVRHTRLVVAPGMKYCCETRAYTGEQIAL
ncbi:hypothetical protein DFJ77DRAFT_462880 [Powellomyces hirtus]|nr:hypothetical protein DFJ77DRAFT_462880 [Powellomyces hirtus]